MRRAGVLLSIVILSALAACSSAKSSASDDPSSSASSSHLSTSDSTTSAPPPPSSSADRPSSASPSASASSASPSPTHQRTPPPDPSGFSLDGRRVVAYYGSAESPGLGVLGQTDPETAWRQVAARARQFATPGHQPLPAFELIATTASDSPGADGAYRTVTPDNLIDRYYQVIHRHHGLLVIDVQPGRATFPAEVKRYAKWLRHPDVGLALDAEWRMSNGGVPGQQIGSVSAAEINEVSAWLDRLTAQAQLPKKMLLLHKFVESMITNVRELEARPHLLTVMNVDGFGSQGQKSGEYTSFYAENHFPMGMKLFFKQDTPMFTAAQVLALKPAPTMIDFQ